MPTPEEVLTEITDADGPLFASYAPFWADVFNDSEPLRSKLASRQGKLKPDAVHGLVSLLNDPTTGRTTRAKEMPRGSFLAALATFAPRIAALPDAAKLRLWTLTLDMLGNGSDVIDVTQPSIQGLLNLAVADELMTSEERASFMDAGPKACSRAEELGWTAVTGDVIEQAKEIE